MKTITINLYQFSELSETAKQKAIQRHRDFLLSVMQQTDFISGDEEYDTPEQLQKCYESEYEYTDSNDEPIIESIEANDYLFFADGELTSCVTYCGKHPKAGITELTIGGDIYLL